MGAAGMGTDLPHPTLSSLSCRMALFSSSLAASACARVCTAAAQARHCHVPFPTFPHDPLVSGVYHRGLKDRGAWNLAPKPPRCV